MNDEGRHPGRPRQPHLGGPCAVEFDELRERIARGVVRVDVVVQKFRGKAAA